MLACNSHNAQAVVRIQGVSRNASPKVVNPMIGPSAAMAAKTSGKDSAVRSAAVRFPPAAMRNASTTQIANRNAVLTLRVPNEQESANTTKVAIQVPPGFLDVTTDPPPGWTAQTKTEKLAKPVQTDDGPIDTQVTEVVFSGGKIPPEQFGQFPLAVVIPDAAPKLMTFKVVQTYSNGDVSRWIGSPSSESPAPTVATVTPGGLLVDAAGSETGPPANIPSTTINKSASVTKVVKEDSGSDKTLAVIALVLAVLAVILGLVAVLRRRPAAGG